MSIAFNPTNKVDFVVVQITSAHQLDTSGIKEDSVVPSAMTRFIF